MSTIDLIEHNYKQASCLVDVYVWAPKRIIDPLNSNRSCMLMNSFKYTLLTCMSALCICELFLGNL